MYNHVRLLYNYQNKLRNEEKLKTLWVNRNKSFKVSDFENLSEEEKLSFRQSCLDYYNDQFERLLSINPGFELPSFLDLDIPTSDEKLQHDIETFKKITSIAVNQNKKGQIENKIKAEIKKKMLAHQERL